MEDDPMPPALTADPDPESVLPVTEAFPVSPPNGPPSAPAGLPPSAAVPAATQRRWSDAQRALVGLAAIVIVVVLVGLIATRDASTSPTPEPRPDPEPIICLGSDEACCIERYGRAECCPMPDDSPGLFDAESDFAPDDADRC